MEYIIERSDNEDLYLAGIIGVLQNMIGFNQVESSIETDHIGTTMVDVRFKAFMPPDWSWGRPPGINVREVFSSDALPTETIPRMKMPPKPPTRSEAAKEVFGEDAK
jgi:hypothetical protein